MIMTMMKHLLFALVLTGLASAANATPSLRAVKEISTEEKLGEEVREGYDDQQMDPFAVYD